MKELIDLLIDKMVLLRKQQDVQFDCIEKFGAVVEKCIPDLVARIERLEAASSPDPMTLAKAEAERNLTEPPNDPTLPREEQP